MATLVDSSVLIAAERGQIDTERILETHAGPDARIAITHRYLAAIGLKP